MLNNTPGKLFGHTRAWDTWASGELKARVWPCGLCHCFIWFGLHYCLSMMQFPHGNFIEFSGGLFWWNEILANIHLALALPPQLSPKQNIARSSKARQLHFYCAATWTMKAWETRHSGLYLGTWKLGCEVCCFLLPKAISIPKGDMALRRTGCFAAFLWKPQKQLKHYIQVLTPFTPCWSMFSPKLIHSLKLEPGEDVLLDIISGFLTADSIGWLHWYTGKTQITMDAHPCEGLTFLYPC